MSHPIRASFVFIVLALVVAGAAACAPKAKPARAPAAAAPSPAAAPAPAAPAAAAAAPASPVPAAPAVPPAPPLTGKVTRAAVESFNDQWKALRAQDYEPDAAAVATIREKSKGVAVYAVVATWCPDTRRDLPRFFKIADKAGWALDKMTLLAVDRTKKDADGETVKWNVTRVPTFIFLRAGQEIGRVIERPTTTLEQDVAAILK
jgi:hypothetical protein